MVSTNNQLNFLQEKIQEIGSAIFFNLSDSVLKLPTSIVTTLKVDEYGYVWFFVQKPKQSLREFDTEFPAQLDFFRKGKNYFLQVSGKAWMVTDPEETNTFVAMSDDLKDTELNQVVLVKVKMLKAEYRDIQARPQNSWWHNAAGLFTWFRNDGYKGYTYYAS